MNPHEDEATAKVWEEGFEAGVTALIQRIIYLLLEYDGGEE